MFNMGFSGLAKIAGVGVLAGVLAGASGCVDKGYMTQQQGIAQKHPSLSEQEKYLIQDGYEYLVKNPGEVSKLARSCGQDTNYVLWLKRVFGDRKKFREEDRAMAAWVVSQLEGIAGTGGMPSLH